MLKLREYSERGGSWLNDGRNCRAAHRFSSGPDSRSQRIGFRLAAVLSVGAK